MEEEPGRTEKAAEVLALLADYGELDSARADAYAFAARAQDVLAPLPDNQYRRAPGDIAQFIVERDR